MQRIKAVAWKEILHILRDPRTLALIIMMPAMQLIIYGYAIDTDVKHIRTALYDESKTEISRHLIDAFEQSAYFDVILKVASPEQLRQSLDNGKVKAGIWIPPDFARNVFSSRSAPVQLLIDGTDSTPANTALNTSRAIVVSFAQRERLSPVSVLPIDLRPRMWYNPDLKSSFFMVPGLVGLLLQLLIPMITATAVVREKESGNIEQLLVTPIKPYELMTGKLIPYVIIGLIIAGLILGAAHLLFQVPVRGSLFSLFIATFLFLSVCLGIGLFASTLAQNQRQAAQMVMFFAPPSILLSGFIFPREAMPLPIYYLSFGIPLTYFLTIIRSIVLKGIGLFALWDQVLPLLAMAIGIVTLSIMKFHKRLK